MSIFTSYRAGSGSYQNAFPIIVNNSTTVNASGAALLTLSTGNLADGSLQNLAQDSIYMCQFANPGLTSTSASLGSISGVVIMDSWVSTGTSATTGAGNNVLFLWMQNNTATTATIPSSTQINLLQL
jgi:hypothetical protein